MQGRGGGGAGERERERERSKGRRCSVLVDQVACCVHLAKGQFVVILVVQDVHQIRVEGVHVVEVWELGTSTSEVRQYF